MIIQDYVTMINDHLSICNNDHWPRSFFAMQQTNFWSELSADLICQPLSNNVETATRLNALYIYLVMQNGDIIYILYVYTHSDMLLVFMLAYAKVNT